MIGYLQGEILEHADGKMLLGVGDKKAGGVVGYSVSVPHSAFYGKYIAGQIVELFVYTHVREEAFDLYGFTTQFEKNLFLTLLSVNGVGPKSALGILSVVEPEQLVEAIIQGDQAFLTRAPGIGKKTAERVVVELRDSIKKKVDLGLLARSEKSFAGTSVPVIEGSFRSGTSALNETPVIRDAKEALIGLGYREQEVLQLLNRVLKESEPQPQRAEDLIKTALRQLI
jgi:Holliday junction DNA helicase RuvA